MAEVALHQIDMYYGEDNPVSPSAADLPSGAVSYYDMNNAIVVLDGC